MAEKNVGCLRFGTLENLLRMAIQMIFFVIFQANLLNKSGFLVISQVICKDNLQHPHQNGHFNLLNFMLPR